MDQLPLALAFSAGLLATVNPCGWAMLPSFAAYYLGSREKGFDQKPVTSRVLEGLRLGLLVTAGFLVVFGTVGLAISAGLRVIVKLMPLLAMLVGGALVLLGIWLLWGKGLPVSVTLPRVDVRVRNPRSVFLFGAAYGLASLSCTLPVFLAVIGASLATAGFLAGATVFGMYGAGMATVLMTVALSAAMLKGAVAERFRALLPYVHRLGAALLVLAGLYLIWYQGRYLPLMLAGL